MPTKEKKAGTKNAVTFKNKELVEVMGWLNVPLHSEQARARNKIVDILNTEFEIFEKERIAICDKYTDRTPEDNKPIMQDGHYKIKDEHKETFDKEWKDLQDAPVTFDILPSNREHWRIVRNVIEKTNREMDIDQTAFWEKILEALS